MDVTVGGIGVCVLGMMESVAGSGLSKFGMMVAVAGSGLSIMAAPVEPTGRGDGEAGEAAAEQADRPKPMASQRVALMVE